MTTKRKNYQEFIKLCIIFLHGADAAEVFFQPHGAFRQAWWMTKAIYSLKMFLFQHQFTVITKEKHSVKELALFMNLIYVQFWHDTPLARKTSLNDVQLLEAVANCQNRATAKTASDTSSQHIWYFSDILFGLSFLWRQNWRWCENKDCDSASLKRLDSRQSTWAIVSHWPSKLHYIRNCCDLCCALCKWQDEGS